MLKVINEKKHNYKYEFDEYINNNKFDNYSNMIINLIRDTDI